MTFTLPFAHPNFESNIPLKEPITYVIGSQDQDTTFFEGNLDFDNLLGFYQGAGYESAVSERAALIEKKFETGLSDMESKRVAYLTWVKNRIEKIQDAQYKNAKYHALREQQRTLRTEIEQLLQGLTR